MILTVEQYKYMRLFKGMTDGEILEHLGYSRNYKRGLRKWKVANGIKLGGGRTQLLDRTEVEKYLKTHSKTETALHFGVDIGKFRRWLEENNRLKIRR